MKQESDQDLQAEELSSSYDRVAPGEIIIGVFTGLNDQGKPLVSFPENLSTEPLSAITTVALNQQQAGRQVALLFAEGDLDKPVIMGLIHSPLHEMLEIFEMSTNESDAALTGQHDDQGSDHQVEDDQSEGVEVTATTVDDVSLDGKRVVLEGKEEIVLKCGDASITLTKAGKILIRGKYLLNRSTGVNRILGGSVQVN